MRSSQPRLFFGHRGLTSLFGIHRCLLVESKDGRHHYAAHSSTAKIRAGRQADSFDRKSKSPRRLLSPSPPQNLTLTYRFLLGSPAWHEGFLGCGQQQMNGKPWKSGAVGLGGQAAGSAEAIRAFPTVLMETGPCFQRTQTTACRGPCRPLELSWYTGLILSYHSYVIYGSGLELQAPPRTEDLLE